MCWVRGAQQRVSKRAGWGKVKLLTMSRFEEEESSGCVAFERPRFSHIRSGALERGQGQGSFPWGILVGEVFMVDADMRGK